MLCMCTSAWYILERNFRVSALVTVDAKTKNRGLEVYNTLCAEKTVHYFTREYIPLPILADVLPATPKFDV